MAGDDDEVIGRIQATQQSSVELYRRILTPKTEAERVEVTYAGIAIADGTPLDLDDKASVVVAPELRPVVLRRERANTARLSDADQAETTRVSRELRMREELVAIARTRTHERVEAPQLDAPKRWLVAIVLLLGIAAIVLAVANAT